MRKSRILATVLAAFLCVVLSSCGGQTESTESETESGTARAVPGMSEVSAAEATTQPAEATEEQASKASQGERNGNSGKEEGANQGDRQEDVQEPVRSDPLESRINAASLHPQKTGNAALDQLVEKIFNQIFTPGMSPYDKVKACYDYLIRTTSYGGGIIDLNEVDAMMGGVTYEKSGDTLIIYMAYRLLTEHVGVCDYYSAAFVVMTRAIGLETYVVGGTVRTKEGGRTGHAWVNMKLGDTYYNFDPQVEDNNTYNNVIRYTYFGKTDAESGTLYEYRDRAADIREFGNFKTVALPAEEENTIR